MVKKASQIRLASRISTLSDVTLNDDDGLPNLMCAKCKRRVESLENHTLGRKSLKGMRNRLLKIRTFITRHNIILTSLLYQVQTLTSHDTEESENSPESPYLGEIKRMCKQCVPGTSPFARAGERLVIAWKAIMTVEAAGLRGALMRNNSSSLPGLTVSQPVNSLTT